MQATDRNNNLSYRFSNDKTLQDVEEGSSSTFVRPTARRSRSTRFWKRHAWAPGWAFGALCLFILLYNIHRDQYSLLKTSEPEKWSSGNEVLVSYSYYEKDAIQRENAEFFWRMGMGIDSHLQPSRRTSFVVVVNGETCSPCEKLYPLMENDRLVEAFPLTLKNAWSGPSLTMLWRTENEGMDFAAHNVTLEWLERKRERRRYRYYIFLNSSVRGPFIPTYMPKAWQWTRAFTDSLGGPGDVRGVSSSLVCLPEVDAGGSGPRMESWAFALDQLGLDLTVEAGVFWLRKCKLCTDDSGIVVKGEYGLSQALLKAGQNFATLMAKYRVGVDWRDEANWGCNDGVHPSRHGTYDGISMHPFETVFLKASWDVGQPHLERYTSWLLEHAEGKPGTAGTYNEVMYRYAISMAAQEPNNAVDCFKVLKQE